MLYIIKICLWLLAIGRMYAISCVGLDILPAIGECDNNEKINAVALNLFYSYIAGCIFYIFTSYLPCIVNSKKIRPIIVEKKKIIKGKIEDSIKCVFPMTAWNSFSLTE